MKNKRKHIIDNKEIYKLLIEKKTLLEKAKLLTKEITKLEEKRMVLGQKIQVIKDKVIPIITKELKGTMSDFEQPETVDIENKKVVTHIVDVVEDFKERYLEKIKETKLKDTKK